MTWYRPVGNRIGWAAWTAVALLLLAVVPWQMNPGASRDVALAGLAALFAVLLFRCGRMGVGADDTSVAVRNLWRSHQLRNSQIASISSGAPVWLVLMTKGMGPGLVYLEVEGRRRPLYITVTLGQDEVSSGELRTLLARIVGSPVEPEHREWGAQWRIDRYDVRPPRGLGRRVRDR